MAKMVNACVKVKAKMTERVMCNSGGEGEFINNGENENEQGEGDDESACFLGGNQLCM